MSTRLARIGESTAGIGTPASIDPDRFNEASAIPEVFNGAVLDDLSIPTTVAAGDVLTVSGRVTLDCPLCSSDREVRVVAVTDDSEYIDNVGELSGRDIFGGNQSARFSIDIPAPSEPGQTINVRLKAQRNPPVGGWETDNTHGPVQVTTVGQGEQTARSALTYAPWAAGGGAVGYGAATFAGRSPVGGAVAGVGAGVATKLITEQTRGDILPDFPTTEVLALAGLLGAGALFLSTSGAGEIGQGIGRSARTALDEARGQFG